MKNKMILSEIGVAVIAIFTLSCLSGTILWVLYPHIHVLFPNAATNGIIAEKLSWFDSVCVTWLFSSLFKSSISTKK